MESINKITPLPPGLQKEANIRNLLTRGARALRGGLIGYSDDALREAGKLKGIRQYVSRSGFSAPRWNSAINIGATSVDDAGRLLDVSNTIPGTNFISGAITRAAKTPGSSLDKWYNPLGWYTGGSSGLNILKSRFQQGGLFGRGGIAHGTFAVNPRLGWNFRDLKAGRRLLPNFSRKGDNLWQRFDTGSILGTAGRGSAEVFKKGIGIGIPAAGLYGAFNPAEDDPRGLGQRLGGAVGSTLGTYASWPLGALSYLPSMAAPLVTSNKAVLDAAESITPWALGETAGEIVGSLGSRKKYDPAQAQNARLQREYQQELLRRSLLQQQYLNSMSVDTPQLPRGLRSMPGPYGSRVMLTPGMLENSVGYRAGLSLANRYNPSASNKRLVRSVRTRGGLPVLEEYGPTLGERMSSQPPLPPGLNSE